MDWICRQVTIGLILIGWLLTAALPVAATPTRLPQAQGSETSGPTALDIYLIVDESSSMWNQNDRDGLRIRAVEFFIDTLGAIPSLDSRVAILVFGDNVRTVAELQSIQTERVREQLKTQLNRVHQEIGKGGGLGYTDIKAVWDELHNKLERQHDPERRTAIILITDGQPETQKANLFLDPTVSGPLRAYLEEVRAAFEALQVFPYTGPDCQGVRPQAGIPLYVLAFSQGLLSTYSEGAFDNIWEELTTRSGGAFIRTRNLEELPGQLLIALENLACLAPMNPFPEETMSVGPSAGANPPKISLVANELISSFVVSILKNKPEADLQVEVFHQGKRQSPNAYIRRTPNALGEVWTIRQHEGWEGEWTLSVQSDEEVQIQARILPVTDAFTLIFDRPASAIYPRFKPVPIQIRVMSKDGANVSEWLQQPSAVLYDPRQRQMTPIDLALERTEEGPVWRGRYQDSAPYSPDDPGDRELIIEGTVRTPEGTEIPLQRRLPLRLAPWPWLRPLEPSPAVEYPANRPIPLQAEVMVENNPDPAMAQVGQVRARLLSSTEQEIWSASLKPDPNLGDAMVVGEIPGDLNLAPGRYWVEYVLEAPQVGDRVRTILNVGSPLPTATPTATATATPPPAPTPTPTPGPTLGERLQPLGRALVRSLPTLGMGFLGLALLLGAWSVLSRPTLDGVVLSFADGRESYLRGGRFGRYRFHLGETRDGANAASLSIRPKSASRGMTIEAQVDKLADEIPHVRVGNSWNTARPQYQGDRFEWRHGERIFVSEKEWVELDNQKEPPPEFL